jgi:hypothetical protein
VGFSENLYTPSVSIFCLPSAIDHPHHDFHNTATTVTTAAATAAATTDAHNNKCAYNKQNRSDEMFERQ